MKMKLTHGSEHIANGKLRGSTDRSDYFYFFCPRCPGDQILRVLGFDKLREEEGSEYNDKCRSKVRTTFAFGFELYCEHCAFHDYVKLANNGYQGGTHAETLGRLDASKVCQGRI